MVMGFCVIVETVVGQVLVVIVYSITWGKLMY